MRYMTEKITRLEIIGAVAERIVAIKRGQMFANPDSADWRLRCDEATDAIRALFHDD